MQLLVPIGGLSERYGLAKPKWLLTHPDGSYMIEKAIDCLSPDFNFKKIIIVTTEEVLSGFQISKETIESVFKEKSYYEKISVEVLEGGSGSHLETVCRGINVSGLSGPIFIKDCDNVFHLGSLAIGQQGVISKKLKESSDVRRLQQKCFISCSSEYEISKLVEKKVVSDEFAIGGYIFNSCEKLRKVFEKKPELHYISEAINQLIDSGDEFLSMPAKNYVDWGTLVEWKEYCSEYKNIFCDIDGVILKNGSKSIKPIWGEQEPIKKNVEAILAMQRAGNCKIVLATARPESYREVTERQMRELGIEFHALVMGLHHARRLVVNDFGGVTSPYPSAEALSVKRDSSEFSEKISDFFLKKGD